MVAAAASLALLGTGVAQAAGPYPPPSKGTGHVEPSRIKIGECAVFSGDGFAPLTTVAVSDNGAARGTATTNANGEFSKQLCYPSGSKRGRHDLAGSGTGSDGQPLTVYAVLIVEGVSQSAGNPGTHAGGGPNQSSGATPTEVNGGAAEAPPATDGGTSSTAPVGSENSGTRLLLLGVAALGFAFLASQLLLLLARRRNRREDDAPSLGGASPLPA
jgi:hypothetical protein